MARRKTIGMRAELTSGAYFDVLLPHPLSRTDRKEVARELRAMAETIVDSETRLRTLTPEGVLEVISDLVCDDGDEDPDDDD
jgi:hypothetical protein